MCVWECGLRPNKLLFNREDDDDELWDFWVPCCTGKLISHDNGLMASMVGTLGIPWVMALVEDDPSTYDGSSALLHLECTIASHVFLCAFFFFKLCYLCLLVAFMCSVLLTTSQVHCWLWAPDFVAQISMCGCFCLSNPDFFLVEIEITILVGSTVLPCSYRLHLLWWNCGWKESCTSGSLLVTLKPCKSWDYNGMLTIYQLVQDFFHPPNLSICMNQITMFLHFSGEPNMFSTCFLVNVPVSVSSCHDLPF